MSSSTETGEVKDLNLSLCIICRQIKPNERLVMTENWGTYKNERLTDHLEFFKSWSKLKTFTAQKLKDKGASWYTQCSSGIRAPSIRECSGEKENGTREIWLGLMKQDRRFQTWHQRKYRC